MAARRRGLYNAISSYRRVYDRSYIEDLISNRSEANSALYNVPNYLVFSWKERMGQCLQRYFRRHHDGHCTVGAWNRAIDKYVGDSGIFGRGSVIATRHIRVTEGTYFDGYRDITRTRNHSEDYEDRVTIRNIVGKKHTHTYGQIRARIARYQKFLEERAKRDELAVRREAKKVLNAAQSVKRSPAQLYRHWDKDGRLLYVGIACNFVNRLAQHRNDSAWFPLIANVTIQHFDSREEAAAAEVHAIRTELPIFNRAHSVIDLAA
ncbi:GIY-YIG nuclease family protein [Pseudoxanthomonas kalamensis]|uniref:GIY-YIG nuclease family protein n=1 Tax=Pseudoxanthomonas kalamensis TaxID=289483 RepID=UPI0031B58C10